MSRRHEGHKLISSKALAVVKTPNANLSNEETIGTFIGHIQKIKQELESSLKHMQEQICWINSKVSINQLEKFKGKPKKMRNR